VPILKIAHFLRAGCTVKILLADIHGFLDNLKAPLELITHRASYYRLVITSLLHSLSIPTSSLEFILGSSYQLTPAYSMDLFRLSSVVTEHDAKKAGAEVVKQVDNATLSGLIYPLMQALDEEHLHVDAQFGGVDQRKIFALATETLPKIGYRERAHLMNPMVPGLAGGKMSSSEPDSKIDVLDTAEAVTRKLKKAHAAPKEIEGNGLISFVEYVLLPVSGLKNAGKPKFVVERRPKKNEENGEEGVKQESLVYTSIAQLKTDYASDILTPQLLKPAVTAALLELLAPIQAEYRASSEWQAIEQRAYPQPPSQKKVKKAKDKGSRHPGVQAMPDGHVKGEEKGEVDLTRGGVDKAMGELQIAQEEKSAEP